MSKTYQPDSLHPYIMDARLKKATGSGDGSISGIPYSTTEHKTGRKWIDGKDVYEITFKFNTTEGQQKTDSGVTLPARDKVISLSGMLGNTVPVYSNVDDSVGVIIENEKLVYYVPNWATTSQMYITMLYTKPTTP